MVIPNPAQITTAPPRPHPRTPEQTRNGVLPVPIGWKIVPVCADLAMMEAAWHASRIYKEDFKKAYKAAIAVAPSCDAAASTEFYWRDVLSRRMRPADEVDRLVTVLRGFHAQASEKGSLVDFWHSSRPYGNKNIANSIAYNLGWDYARRLCTENMPDWVESEAMMLHDAVLADIQRNQ